jgi:hypothetical protein
MEPLWLRIISLQGEVLIRRSRSREFAATGYREKWAFNDEYLLWQFFRSATFLAFSLRLAWLQRA